MSNDNKETQIREITSIHEDISRHMTETVNILRTIPSNVVSVDLIRYSCFCSLLYACHPIEEPFFPCRLINVLDLAVPNVLSISMGSRLQ
jgi:hypothetical protein